jgi:putative ABC transport system permease protein
MYSLISLSGLILAFTVSFLILIYAINELGINKEFVNSSRIYRVLNHIKSTSTSWAITVKDLGPQIKASMPEIEGATRMLRSIHTKVISDEKRIPTEAIFIDNDFFAMFENATGINNTIKFDDAYSVVITKLLADKISPEIPLIGQTIELSVFNKEVFVKVIRVIDGLTEKSNIQADLFLSMDLFEKTNDAAIIEWHPFFHTFVMVPLGANMKSVQAGFDAMDKDHFDDVKTSKFELQPFPDFYLDSAGLSGHSYQTGDKSKIQLFLTVASLLLLIAIVNYTVLATANALYRQKEFGIRKSFGSDRKRLRLQTLSESMTMAFIALPVSIILTELLLPYANQFWEKELDFHIIRNWPILLVFFFLSIFTGLVSGSYLSFYISKLNPTLILSSSGNKRSGVTMRRTLIVIQIFIFVVLSSFSALVLKQMDYFQSKPMGYDPENLVIFELNQKDGINEKGINPLRVQSFLNELRKNHEIKSASFFGMDVPPFQDNTGSQAVATPENPTESKIFLSLSGDAELFETLGLKIIEGRNFIEGSYDEILITETGIKYLDLDDPIGEIIAAGGNCKIVGIVKDFHSQSFRRDIGPLLIRQADPEHLSRFAYRLNFGFRIQPESDIRSTDIVKKMISSSFPEYDFKMEYQEDRIKGIYQNEQKIAQTVIIGVVIVIFISTMGLFALSLYESEHRTKEIAIRKINGANTSNIVILLSKEFTKWVILAFVLAIPFSYFFMEKWLENYIYQTLISWWIFALTGAITLLITWLTISFQSVKAASRNPVISLRND